MSGEALGWAIHQKAGSPSAKAVLLSLANYADKRWCVCESQAAIAEFGEHSADAVQKWLPTLEQRILIRRIPLFFGGRRYVDFIVLAPSGLFSAPLSDLEPYFPRGCMVEPKYAAANPGSGPVAPASVLSIGENPLPPGIDTANSGDATAICP
jgi:hypothetical protein